MTLHSPIKVSSIVPHAAASDSVSSPSHSTASEGTYLAAYVEQTPIVRMKPGDSTIARLWLKNIGTATWLKDSNHPVMLGTDHPFDRAGLLYAEGIWPFVNRPAGMVERAVHPGETATFEVVLHAPTIPGRYREWVRPVAENLIWFNDLELAFVIDVVSDLIQHGPMLGAELVEQPAPLLLPPNGRGIVRLRFRNVGRMRWTHRGTIYGPLVMLGLYDVNVQQARFFDPDSWNTPQRAALVSGIVLPGETSEIHFTVRAPNEPGSYSESYALVAEEMAWFTGPIAIKVIVP